MKKALKLKAPKTFGTIICEVVHHVNNRQQRAQMKNNTNNNSSNSTQYKRCRKKIRNGRYAPFQHQNAQHFSLNFICSKTRHAKRHCHRSLAQIHIPNLFIPNALACLNIQIIIINCIVLHCTIFVSSIPQMKMSNEVNKIDSIEREKVRKKIEWD